MTARFLMSVALAMLPASAFAQALTDTHETISVPGKAIHAYRPLEQGRDWVAKCHPDATKAVACEAMQQRVRAEQLARKRGAEAVRFGSR